MASSFLSTLFALTLVVTDAASSLSISESGTLASVNQHRSLMRKDGAQADPDPAGTTAADTDAAAAVTAGGTVAPTDAAAGGTCASPGTLPETPECGKFEGCKATGKNNREELELGDQTPCANVKDANGVNLDLIECSCKRTETVGQVVAMKDAAGNDIVQEEFTCCHKDYQNWKDVLPGSTIESVPTDPTCHDTCYKVSGSGIIQSKADKKPIALPGANDPAAQEALGTKTVNTNGTKKEETCSDWSGECSAGTELDATKNAESCEGAACQTTCCKAE